MFLGSIEQHDENWLVDQQEMLQWRYIFTIRKQQNRFYIYDFCVILEVYVNSETLDLIEV